MNAMREIRVDKVVVNIGVGEAGERLVKAQKVLEMVTGQKSVQTISKTVNRDLGIRVGMPLGCKVTLRGEAAEDFITRALPIREMRVPVYSFDKEGNMSFGITDYDLSHYRGWIGKIGGVRVKHEDYNGSPSAKVSFCLNKKNQEKLPAWKGEAQAATPTAYGGNTPRFTEIPNDDSLPF